MSNPTSNGRWIHGLANVLSPTDSSSFSAANQILCVRRDFAGHKSMFDRWGNYRAGGGVRRLPGVDGSGCKSLRFLLRHAIKPFSLDTSGDQCE
jgi:hypothetical protein